MNNEQLMEMITRAKAAYDAMTPLQKAYHDHEQKRSFIRGMCPSHRDYKEWCKIVDKFMPPLKKERK